MDDNTRDVVIAILNTIKAMRDMIVKLAIVGGAAHWKDDILLLVSEIIATLRSP